MQLPDYQAFMLPVLSVVARGETRSSEALERGVADLLGLAPARRAEVLPFNGQRVVQARVEHAARDLVIAGLIAADGRGFSVTTRGAEVLDANPSRLDRTTLERFEAYAAHRAEVLRRRGA